MEDLLIIAATTCGAQVETCAPQWLLLPRHAHGVELMPAGRWDPDGLSWHLAGGEMDQHVPASWQRQATVVFGTTHLRSPLLRDRVPSVAELCPSLQVGIDLDLWELHRPPHDRALYLGPPRR